MRKFIVIENNRGRGLLPLLSYRSTWPRTRPTPRCTPPLHTCSTAGRLPLLPLVGSPGPVPTDARLPPPSSWCPLPRWPPMDIPHGTTSPRRPPSRGGGRRGRPPPPPDATQGATALAWRGRPPPLRPGQRPPGPLRPPRRQTPPPRAATPPPRPTWHAAPSPLPFFYPVPQPRVQAVSPSRVRGRRRPFKGSRHSTR